MAPITPNGSLSLEQDFILRGSQTPTGPPLRSPLDEMKEDVEKHESIIQAHG